MKIYLYEYSYKTIGLSTQPELIKTSTVFNSKASALDFMLLNNQNGRYLISLEPDLHLNQGEA